MYDYHENSDWKLNGDNIVYLKSQSYSEYIGGSSSLVCVNNNLEIIEKTKKIIKPKKIKKSIDIENDIDKDNNNKKPLKFTVNKKYVRNKISAFAQLKQSKKFMCFWTITYPQGFPDESSKNVLNNVFTTIKNVYGKFSYILVSERQKNGTIHQHLITNKYLNVRIINQYFRKAIRTELKNLTHLNLKFDYNNYNGLDMTYISNIKAVKRYITKYVTKSMESFTVKAYSMSYDCARLFTSILIGHDEANKFIQKFHDLNLISSVFYDSFFTIYFFNNSPPSQLYKPLREANEYIYNNY